MILEFNKQENGWVSEFVVTADFNLHIEGVAEGNVRIYQRGSENGEYAYVRGGTPYPSFAKVYDFDFSALVYPKFIKVLCATEPESAKVITEGEITELKNQEKEITVEKNGKTTITPDEGFNALSKVVVRTAVGEKIEVVAKDVNFYDYDGTLLHSYTWDEAKAMKSLPALPKREGLICQEWNYTLEDIKEQNGKCDVGATYITDDGKTRLYIHLPAERGLKIPLNFTQTVANGVTIDWGDGSATETLSGTDSVIKYHFYTSAGDYCITLDVADGCVIGLGKGSSSAGIFGNSGSSDSNAESLVKVEIGKGVEEIKPYAFRGCSFLETISIPKGVASVGNYAFGDCYSLKSISLPQGITSIGNYMCMSCFSLTTMSIAKGITSFDYFGNGCHTLLSAVIPKGVVSLSNNAFNSCYAIKSILIPEGVTSIEQYTFAYCYSLESIKLPSTVASIASSAFRYCYRMKMYDFSKHTTVPSLLATGVFSPIPSDCKIVVPDALYDEWIAATNWSSVASYIVKASEYNA